MRLFSFPERDTWKELARRPESSLKDLDSYVSEIITNVKFRGDAALREYSRKYDNTDAWPLRVSDEEIAEAEALITESLKESIAFAARNIERFHKPQIQPEQPVATTPGVICYRRSVPIESVGLYIPGGSAPLFSTVLMLGIPAVIAGCKRVFICTPASGNGKIHPAVIYTASYLGINEIYKTGGAQAIAAMAYGSETIPKADKIFGPGNSYVTRAKQLVQTDGSSIDMPAGPSELLVVAGRNSKAEYIAADLLSQAEHGPDSQVILVTSDKEIINAVEQQISVQIGYLPRKETAEKALLNSFSVLLKSPAECVEFSNVYAPEHLILSVDNAGELANLVTNAGSVFIGEYSCESAGDYASGTNHTLPTGGSSRSYSGISVESFMKKITFQEISREGLMNISGAIETMAEAEQLEAHRNAVTVRLKS